MKIRYRSLDAAASGAVSVASLRTVSCCSHARIAGMIATVLPGVSLLRPIVDHHFLCTVKRYVRTIFNVLVPNIFMQTVAEFYAQLR